MKEGRIEKEKREEKGYDWISSEDESSKGLKNDPLLANI